MKTNLGDKFIFIWRSHIKISENSNFQTAVQIVWQVVLPKILHLGIRFGAEPESGIHFVSGSTVTTSLVLMSRTDFENWICVWILIIRIVSLDILIILRETMLCYCLPLFYLVSILFIHILHFNSTIYLLLLSRFHANISCLLT